MITPEAFKDFERNLLWSRNCFAFIWVTRFFQGFERILIEITYTRQTLLCLNVRSLNKHLEDLESLVYSLKCPSLVLCPTEIRLLRNDYHKNIAAGYKQLEASNRDKRLGDDCKRTNARKIEYHKKLTSTL